MIKEVHGGNIYKFNRPILDFSANLNPFGIDESIKKAIIDNVDNYSIYPDINNFPLKDEIASWLNLKRENIVLGNGAADIIFKLPLGFKPKKVLILSPTFSEYESAAKVVESHIDYFFLKEEDDFILNVEDFLSVLDKGYNMVFICNPNNPTGIPISKDKMEKIHEKCKEKNSLFVVDECFLDFIKDRENYSIIQEAKSSKNLIVIKAFTKMFSMAGIRLGYGVCHPHNSSLLEGLLQPWSVSTVATKAGLAAVNLGKNSSYILDTINLVDNERNLVCKTFDDLGIKYYPSSVNYLLFRGREDTYQRLLQKDILIRKCENYPGLDGSFFRIAIKSREENKRILEAMRDIANEVM